MSGLPPEAGVLSLPVSPRAARDWLLGVPGRSGFLERLGGGLVVLTIILGTYHLVAAKTTPLPISLLTWVDQAIPFLPWTGWFYVPGYVMVFLIPVLFIDDRRSYAVTVSGLLAAALPCWILHALLPIAYPRPAAPVDPGIGADFVRWIYATDPAANTFPSMHVAMATITTVATLMRHRRYGRWCAAFTVAMTLSVLTTKQHFLVDIFGGWAVAAAVWAGVLRGRVDRDPSDR